METRTTARVCHHVRVTDAADMTAGPLLPTTVRLRSDQVDRMADWILRANAELIDEARASGHLRLDYRVTDSDLVRLALDELLTRSWEDVRADAHREAQRSRPGRPRTTTSRRRAPGGHRP